MGIRLSGRFLDNTSLGSRVQTSIGAPGTGIDLYDTSNGDAKFILGTVVVLAIAALVWWVG